MTYTVKRIQDKIDELKTPFLLARTGCSGKLREIEELLEQLCKEHKQVIDSRRELTQALDNALRLLSLPDHAWEANDYKQRSEAGSTWSKYKIYIQDNDHD